VPLAARIKLFMALSRTPHGLLDMATPALGALLWLGAAPRFEVAALGILTAFAGYTAVYALNDLVDYHSDREKLDRCGARCAGGDLDSVYARHPIALGLLSLKEGIAWTAAWGAVALWGAYTLNPACALIFVLGCVAEAVYCLMLQLSYLRVFVSGAVKTAGGMAAVFAVAAKPSVLFLLVLFLWLFLWEIGGQNVPNDWSDLDEDRSLEVETTPVRFGADGSARIILWSLVAAVGLSIGIFWATPAQMSLLYLPGALASGIFCLLMPARRLYQKRTSVSAAALFNRASLYPAAMLAIVLLSSIF
jgi:4-hydroxybenzoate polyprenyltransferase